MLEIPSVKRPPKTAGTIYLFEGVTQHIDESPDIPSSVWNDFEKLASISVSSSQNGEQFHPDS